MNYMEFIWLAVAVVAAVVEAAVPALVSIWFVPGSILALAASLLGGPLWLQLALFVGATVLAILFTRPLARRLQKNGPTSTNADRVLGATAVVTEEVNNLLGQGRVSVMGSSWAARSLSPEEALGPGEEVTVIRIEGVKLIVAPAAKAKGENL